MVKGEGGGGGLTHGLVVLFNVNRNFLHECIDGCENLLLFGYGLCFELS